jgi:hypothetical protein
MVIEEPTEEVHDSIVSKDTPKHEVDPHNDVEEYITETIQTTLQQWTSQPDLEPGAALCHLRVPGRGATGPLHRLQIDAAAGESLRVT